METLDKSVEIAQSFLADKQAEKQAIEAEEGKKANEGKSAEQLEKETQEAEETKRLAEEKEKEEESLLDADDEELDEEAKKKKVELEENLKDEPLERKLRRHQQKTEKRINKLVAKLKGNEEQSVAEKQRLIDEIVGLRDEITQLKQPIVKAEEQKTHLSNIEKIIAEDSDLPREERREMSEEELDEWYMEEPRKATDWQYNRNKRRDAEVAENQNKEQGAKLAEKFIAKQSESVNRLIKEFPGTKPEARAIELKAQGKTGAEIDAILNTEIQEYKLCNDIVTAHPEWMKEENFGDLVAAEIKKLIKPGNKPEGKKMYTEEEVLEREEKARKLETERRALIDGGSGSSTITKPLLPSGGKKSAKLIALEELYSKAGLDPSLAAKRLEIRSKIPGISNYDPNNDKDEV